MQSYDLQNYDQILLYTMITFLVIGHTTRVIHMTIIILIEQGTHLYELRVHLRHIESGKTKVHVTFFLR